MFNSVYISLVWSRCNFYFNTSRQLIINIIFRPASNAQMPKPGFYAVRVGRKPGVYETWAECEAQVKGYPDAAFKKFPSRDLAQKFVGEKAVTKETRNRGVTVLPGSYIFNASKRNPDHLPQISSFLTSVSDTTVPPPLIYSTNQSKPSFYAVHRGRVPGIYKSWTECELQIKDIKRPSYRKFENEEDALEYVRTGGITKASKRELQELRYENRVCKQQKLLPNDGCEYALVDANKEVVVFTDGACTENGRKRACAGIGVYWGHNHPLNTSMRLGGRQTNNRAEIWAAIHALRQSKQIGAKKVKLYTDSQFLIHAITDWISKWQNNNWTLATGETVVNKDDFIELNASRKDLDVEWIYVKAHARIDGNEQADRLAVAGSKKILDPATCCDSLINTNTNEDTEEEPFLVEMTEMEILPLVLPNVSKQTFYAVHRGKLPGVYSTWVDCQKQIKDFVNPSFRKFDSEEEAIAFINTGRIPKKEVKVLEFNDIPYGTIYTDGARNTGKLHKKEVKVPEFNDTEYVTIYTDGASSSNGKEEAKAGIGVYWGPDNVLNTSMRLPGRQTNNRAEIFAAVHALNQAKKLGIKNVKLYTDSKFVIKGIEEWIYKWKENDWKSANNKPVINKDDFIALDIARTGLNVEWCYVKGHSDSLGNNEADKLAVAGCNKPLSETILIRSLIRQCVPRKDPKEWVKGKCEDNTEKLEDIEACYLCVDNFSLPQNVTKDDVRAMRRSCLPQPSLKFKAKRKCAKKLHNKVDIETCQACIQSYDLPEKPSCEEVNEMKRHCLTERSGRELWNEPEMQDDYDDDDSL